MDRLGGILLVFLALRAARSIIAFSAKQKSMFIDRHFNTQHRFKASEALDGIADVLL